MKNHFLKVFLVLVLFGWSRTPGLSSGKGSAQPSFKEEAAPSGIPKFELIGGAPSPYQALFWRQIQQTCQEQLYWEKSVREVGSDGQPLEDSPETRRFRVDCSNGTFTTLNPATSTESREAAPVQIGTDELDFLFEYNALDPFLREYFSLERQNGGFRATLQEQFKGKTPLQSQIFQLDERGVLRYAESHILKDNFLYYLEVRIKVWFDVEGRYQRHWVSTATETLAAGGVSTIIKGKVLPR